MNARDYPQAASAAFALGRALATKGDKARARKELERALALDPTHKRADEGLKRLRP